ncbi:MAG: peptidoglycan DD-metalloendopeptidase family protein [Chloroflexi bacterium]|nr:peptidoglycan DD-metalloendopeptidase family protein [Chloroflexota bacterium]
MIEAVVYRDFGAGLETLMRRFLVLFLLLTGIRLVDAQTAAKPFVLPVASPPGATTWLLGQPYGNTVGAFLTGKNQYEAGQRLHFGLDFSMPCGTPLVAVADGQVGYVDDLSFGSAPHNLILIHAQLGLTTLYGHLLDTPTLEPGTMVKQGDVVAYSGDPEGTCISRPHMHFEVRSMDYYTTYNPVLYIDANWPALAAIGSYSSPLFEQDLDNARQWMSLDDQPEVHFWGKPLNDYAAPYPDYGIGLPAVNPPLAHTVNPLPARWQLRRLAYDGCCAGAWWDAASTNRLFVIDGSPNQRAAIFEWDTDAGSMVNLVGQAPPPLLSPDGSLKVERVNQQIVITRLADGSHWTVDTANTLPAFSADNSRLLWQISHPRPDPGQTQPTTEIWVSDSNGLNARQVLAEPGISARWLDGSRLLISQREKQSTTLSVKDTADDSEFTLGSWDWLRGVSLAPGGARLTFYLVFQDDPVNDGIYTLDIQPDAQPKHLPFFGAWRWRDADSLYYLPFDPAQPSQSLHFYDLASGDDRTLTDQPFLVANGDWSVSPDGDQIAFWNANDFTLWLIEGA